MKLNQNFKFKKSLGQHFLIDNNIIKNIIINCPNLENTNVIEIGPGKGILTELLISNSKTVIAIEKDITLEPYLKKLKKANSKNFNYLIEDAKKTNVTTLTDKPRAIIANLPYNIGTFLFTNWLEYSHEFDYFVLMFQKEVALRITAQPNTKHYSRLTLYTKLYGKAEILFTVSKNCFYPKPLVDSAVIKFVPYVRPLLIDKIKFLEIIKTAFNNRRKTINTSLKKFNLDFEKLGINPKLRPENLSFEQFVLLSQNFQI